MAQKFPKSLIILLLATNDYGNSLHHTATFVVSSFLLIFLQSFKLMLVTRSLDLFAASFVAPVQSVPWYL